VCSVGWQIHTRLLGSYLADDDVFETNAPPDNRASTLKNTNNPLIHQTMTKKMQGFHLAFKDRV